MRSLESTRLDRGRQRATDCALSAQIHLFDYRWAPCAAAMNRAHMAPRISAKLQSAGRLQGPSRGPPILTLTPAPCGTIRGVAQSGSAPASGAGGRWFESNRPDHSSKRALLAIMSKGCQYSCERLLLAPPAVSCAGGEWRRHNPNCGSSVWPRRGCPRSRACGEDG